MAKYIDAEAIRYERHDVYRSIEMNMPSEVLVAYKKQIEAIPAADVIETQTLIEWLDKCIAEYETVNDLYSDDAEKRTIAQAQVAILLAVKANVKKTRKEKAEECGTQAK
jgi:hypothetical protein